ncbi:hypothetical protein C8Q75DRAFT_736042 [Abortiporus biennis]|nr:hypothetical protein C8Q75DRAFT_736042 [Abortiporus biennis]
MTINKHRGPENKLERWHGRRKRKPADDDGEKEVDANSKMLLVVLERDQLRARSSDSKGTNSRDLHGGYRWQREEEEKRLDQSVLLLLKVVHDLFRLRLTC